MEYATRTNPPPTMLAMEYVGAECGGRSQSVSVRFLASVCKEKKGGSRRCFVSMFFSHWNNIVREGGKKGEILFILNCSRRVHVVVAHSSIPAVAVELVQLAAMSIFPAVAPEAATA